jgi:hypothetical protein
MFWHIAILTWHFLRGWGGLVLAGVYGAIRGLDEVLKVMDELFYRFQDFAVFEVIDQPLVLPTTSVSENWVISDAIQQRPYSVKDICDRLGRKEVSVIRSLKRLKRCNRAVESTWGWYSARTAPKDFNP